MKTSWKLSGGLLLCAAFFTALYFLPGAFNPGSVGIGTLTAQPMEEEEEEIQAYPNPLERNVGLVMRSIRSHMTRLGFRGITVKKLSGNRYQATARSFNARYAQGGSRGLVSLKPRMAGNKTRVILFRVRGNKIFVSGKSFARAGLNFNRQLFRARFKKGINKGVAPAR